METRGNARVLSLASSGLRALSARVRSLGFIWSLPGKLQRILSSQSAHLVLVFFEMGCCYVVLAGLKLVAPSRLPHHTLGLRAQQLSSRVAGASGGRDVRLKVDRRGHWLP